MNPKKDQAGSRFWQYLRRQLRTQSLAEDITVLEAGRVPPEIINDVLIYGVILGIGYYPAITIGYKRRLSARAARKLKKYLQWTQSIEKLLVSAVASRQIKGNSKKEGQIDFLIMLCGG
jgi:hypothetical protein